MHSFSNQNSCITGFKNQYISIVWQLDTQFLFKSKENQVHILAFQYKYRMNGQVCVTYNIVGFIRGHLYIT